MLLCAFPLPSVLVSENAHLCCGDALLLASAPLWTPRLMFPVHKKFFFNATSTPEG